jgi:putative DNA-invertase from lambdoid prophage Rac
VANKLLAATAPSVYGYVRVSTDHQRDNGISLDEQQRRIEGRALEMGWQLAGMFVEAGVSGSIPFAGRLEGGRLLKLVKPGDIIVSPKLDRMFRSALDALQTIEALKRRKVSLWLLDLGGDVSGNGISEMMLTILAAVAQFERVRIGERIREAKAHLRAQGRHQGGKRQFGTMIDETSPDRRLVPHPAEQAAIERIHTMRRDGASLMAIRDAMRDMGFPISHETVRKVLTRGAT